MQYPLLMGKEGDKLDGFVSQLSRDMLACRLDNFRWSNYAILMINTLRGTNKNKEKLTEKLTQM